MRSYTALLLCSMAMTTVALPALADGAHHGDRAAADGGSAKPSFPMPAAEFRARVNARLAERDARAEKRIADKKLDAAKAQKIRTHLAERKAKVTVVLDKVCADGTVTADEAKEVRAAGRGPKHRAHRGAHGRRAK